MFVLEKKIAFYFCVISAAVVFCTGTVEAQKKSGISLEFKIKGTIQRPEVSHFLSRAKFTYRTLELDVTFTEKVEEALYIDEAF
ncbi:MAG TPA: hypothetical protein PLZ43_02955 [bacterium]|nr:hypothetical protein [bacterium]